jgi:hypothetical protein
MYSSCHGHLHDASPPFLIFFAHGLGFSKRLLRQGHSRNAQTQTATMIGLEADVWRSVHRGPASMDAPLFASSVLVLFSGSIVLCSRFLCIHQDALPNWMLKMILV